MIVFGLGISKRESEKIHSFFNKEDGFRFGLESDVDKVSWNDSENIIMDRVKFLQNQIYNNTNNNGKNLKVIGEVAFYMLPYLELLINNFPYLKFVCTHQSKKKTYDDILSDIRINSNFFMRIILFKKEYKNHWIRHDGSKWEKDYMLDKCYPKFEVNSLKKSIDKYIDLYHSNLKKIQRKYPKNLRMFYLDELNSDYGKKKVFSFLEMKQ